MEKEQLDGILFANMLREGAVNLDRHRQTVNDLNVFPIPDGDTGDNMYMTIRAGVDAIPAAPSLGDAAQQAANGMLLGARGNSGVILSRFFSGVARSLAGAEKADAAAVSDAFASGVKEAYQAVTVPTEGTILTVFREGVDYAASRLAAAPTVTEYFDDLLGALRRSLERTPELLDVLREAEVVDSGGAGFVYIVEGMRSALEGRLSPVQTAQTQNRTPDVSLFTEDSTLEFGYCTEFLLRLQRAKTDLETFDLAELIAWLEGVGDSVAAFREGTVVKVHVHTRRPGDILNHCQQYGEFLTLKIENMTLQHNEHLAKQPQDAPVRMHKHAGILAVASGSGIKALFSSLGCDEVIEGGQSMNPSAEDFLRAFRRINADVIYVFPNNGNVILTAAQAAELYRDARICVIPSKTVGEGYAAVSMLDLGAEDPEAVTAELTELIADVATGSVSKASRDTKLDGLEIRTGDYIGFSGKEILSDADDKNEAACALLTRMDAGSRDILLLLRGQDASEAEAKALYDRLTACWSRTEIILIDGEQPIYDYIFVLE